MNTSDQWTSVTVKELDQPDRIPDLRILHFNDVYHVDGGSREPIGGVARFQSLCNYYRNDASFHGQPNLLTFFSGDCFNPSLESSVTKGSHMVPLLNNIGVDVACVGNHDFDFGLPHFTKLTKQSNFPWLLSNIFEPDGVTRLANLSPTHLLTSSNGIKVGLIGIAEQEWISTVNALPSNLPFLTSSEAVVKHAAELRKQGAELIIALCHQREVNDNRVASSIPEGVLDIILAGHDHDYRYSKINSCHVLCSGSDFKQLSYIEIYRDSSSASSTPKWKFNITRRDITAAIPEDPPTLDLLTSLFSTLRANLQKPIGFTSCPLDARFSTVRTKESNYGNFLADLIRHYYSADCALVVGGTLRGDQIYPSGVIRLKDIMDCFPFEDPNVLIKVSGANLLLALENGLSKYPALEGRFPQVSGIRYTFDASKPPHHRIVRVSISNRPLDVKRHYKLATRAYTVSGGDDFSSLKTVDNGGEAEWIVDEENGMITSTLLRQYFMSLKVMGKWKCWSEELDKHWEDVKGRLHAVQAVRKASVACVDNRDKGNSNPSPAVTLNGAVPWTPNTPGSNLGGWTEGSDSESDANDIPSLPEEKDAIKKERELKLTRKTLRKWRRVAGCREHADTCDAEDEENGSVDWTRGIEPKCEGRITVIGI